MAERGTDESEDSGLSFDDWLAQRHGPALDPEFDEIFSRDPEPQVDLPCQQCGVLVTEAYADTWVWIHNPERCRPWFIPFCNSMHRDMFLKLGLWASDRKPLPPLSLDEDDDEDN